MVKAKRLLRGLGMTSAVLLAASITTGAIMEQYPAPLDALFDTLSSKVVSEKTEEKDWIFDSNFKTAKEAFDGFKEFAIRESHETFALLKNSNKALPIAKDAKVTLMGLRSYAPVYGNSGGSIADKKTVENGNTITDAFKGRGFQLNPSMLKAYEEYCKTLTWGGSGFGATPPEYVGLAGTADIPALSKAELAQYNPAYASEYAQYNDAAIVVVGRPGGESKYYLKDGQSYSYTEGRGPNQTTVTLTGHQDTTTGNILGLSSEEKEIIAEAKANFSKVIVLVNSVNQMELKELEDDPDIDAVMWVGYPGAYGFWGVADVLNGTVSPSAHLGDIYAANTGINPAMMNSNADTPWTNADGLTGASNVNTYLVQAEGIYTGYRYYETRYEDYVLGQGNAATAGAGAYVTADTKPGAAEGSWNYDYEVVYPFGHGLSYTTFKQTLDSVQILGNKRTANVTVTVTNTGGSAGKDVIQLYAQTPYTEYDKKYGVEKASVQLMDFEKTKELAPGASQTVTMEVDLANLASYDYTHAKTFIVDNGTYYFAIGTDSHDALNNILVKKGVTEDQKKRMSGSGDASKVHEWKWDDGNFEGVDNRTFSVSATGTVNITNRLSEGESAMDFNYFKPGTVTYLSRSDWKGTYPKTYTGLAADTTQELYKLLSCDFIPLKTDDDTSSFKWGDTTSSLTLNDMKLADWEDSRWQEIVDKVTIEEFLTFASNAFHNIQEIPSVGYIGNNADDGPGGSDTHYFEEGSYKGTPYADAKDYEGYGTRVAPSPTNLAYSWNKELAFENGEIILGESTLVLNLPIMIGPGGNIHRHAYNGRGAEYYSEDPMLSGYIGSAVVQGAQSKGCLVNIKHAAFNDQEVNRSGIAVFMNEQKAREMELRNLQQMFVANGMPASFRDDESKKDTYKLGALGVMTSYNRIGAVPPSANKGVMVDIMRNEWGFHGYNVTDFTGVALKASPKESLLYGTTAFCGFGGSMDYWNAETLGKDADMCAAIKQDIKYVLYSLANSAAVNGTNNTTRRVQLMSTWRKLYKSLEGVFGALTGGLVVAYVVLEVLDVVKKKKEED